MKLILFLSLILVAVFLIKCTFSGNSIQYIFDNKSRSLEEKWQNTIGDTITNHSVSFLTYERNTSKNEPIKIQYYFNEKTPEVKSLQSVSTKLWAKGKEGNYYELASSSMLSVEYFNGKNNLKKEIKNQEPIYTMLDWKEVNYGYEFNGVQYTKEPNTLTFDGEISCQTKEYPDTLKLTLTLQWTDKSHTIEKILTKEKYTSPKINPKF